MSNYGLTIDNTTYALSIAASGSVGVNIRAVWVDDFGTNTTPGTTDMTTPIQAAIAYVGALGGGTVVFGYGVYMAAALSQPDNVFLEGLGQNVSTLKLKNSANTWLIATDGWINNENTCGLYGGLRHMTLDGNKANNPTGSLIWHNNYRFTIEKCVVQNSGGSGLVIASTTRNGTTALINGIAETEIKYCSFQNNTTHGVYGYLGVGTKLADQMILNCNFYANGGAGIYAERSVGWKINHNQIYDNGTHAIYVAQFARGEIIGNNLDILASAQGATSITGGIYVNSFSAEGAWVIAENQYIINVAASTTATKKIYGRYFNGASADRGYVGPEPWVDNSVGQLGALEGLSGTAAASLAAVDWGISGRGPSKVLNRTINDFTLSDDADATKIATFDLSNSWPTATTGIVYFPYFATGGTVAYRESNNTFSGTNTFDGALAVSAVVAFGYTTGAGGTVTQATSRTTGVTINKPTGAITLFSAAGSATPATFTVTDSAVAAGDTIRLTMRSGMTNIYHLIPIAAAGSFTVTVFTTGGTTIEAPIINFNIIKCASS